MNTLSHEIRAELTAAMDQLGKVREALRLAKAMGRHVDDPFSVGLAALAGEAAIQKALDATAPAPAPTENP